MLQESQILFATETQLLTCGRPSHCPFFLAKITLNWDSSVLVLGEIVIGSASHGTPLLFCR